MKRLCCLALTLALLACAIPAALAEYTPGTYTAEAAGHEAGLVVTVTVDETGITAVDLDVSNETPEIGGAAKDALIEQIMAAQEEMDTEETGESPEFDPAEAVV